MQIKESKQTKDRRFCRVDLNHSLKNFSKDKFLIFFILLSETERQNLIYVFFSLDFNQKNFSKTEIRSEIENRAHMFLLYM